MLATSAGGRRELSLLRSGIGQRRRARSRERRQRATAASARGHDPADGPRSHTMLIRLPSGSAKPKHRNVPSKDPSIGSTSMPRSVNDV